MLKNIKNLQVAARKNRDGIRATLLTTLIAEIEIRGKNDNRSVTDDDSLTVLRKFKTNITENLALYNTKGGALQDRIVHAEAELSILNELLPVGIADDQVADDIKFILHSNGLALDRKNTKVILGLLKSKYEAKFESEQASAVFGRLISASKI